MIELNEGLDKEKEARIKSEKENMGKINESLFVLKEQLKEEKDERNLKIKELQKYTDSELSSQRKFNEGKVFFIKSSIINALMISRPASMT